MRVLRLDGRNLLGGIPLKGSQWKSRLFMGALIAMAIIPLAAGASFATPVTYEYTGSVVGSSVPGADSEFVGQDWTASLTFDDAAPAGSAGSRAFPNPTSFLDGILSYVIVFTSGVSWSMIDDPGRILLVGNDLETRPRLTSDRFVAQASFTDTPAALSSFEAPSLVLSLIDYDSTAFDQLALPSGALDVNDFEVAAGSLLFPSGGGAVQLDIESVTLVSTPVPEPSTALLLGFGLMALARSRSAVH